MNFIWQKNNFTWPVCTASAAIFLSSCTGSVQKTTVRGGLFGDAVPGVAADGGVARTPAAPAAELFDKVNVDFFSQAIFKSPRHDQVPGIDFHAGLADSSLMAFAAAPWSISPCNDSVAKWAFSGNGNMVTITSETTGASECKSVTEITCFEIEEKDKPGASSGVSESEQPTRFITKWVEACSARQFAADLRDRDNRIYPFGFKQKYVASSTPSEGMSGTTVRLIEGHQGNACQANISSPNTFKFDGDCRYREAHLSAPETKDTDGWMAQNWTRTVEYGGTNWMAVSSIVAPTMFMTIPRSPVRVIYGGNEAFEITFAVPTPKAGSAATHEAAWTGKDNKGHTCSGVSSMVVVQ